MNGLLQMQGELLLLMILGFILTRVGIVKAEGRKLLTDLVVDVTLPASILHSFDAPFESRILTLGGIMILMNLVVQGGGYLLSKVLYRRYTEDQAKVLEYATIFSNAGILGNPVAEGAFGSIGLLYASLYLIPQRILLWSFGLTLFTGKAGSVRDTVKKVLTHPCIISVAAGLVLFISPYQLPGVLSATVQAVASSNTTMSMLLIGSILGGIELNSLIDKDTLYYCAVRLLLIPALAFAGCKLSGMDPTAAGVVVLLTAMPAASTTAVLSSKYGRDAELASRLVALSTILSVATAPLWCLLFTL